ncbi:MAG: DUF2723 domain-containing protein [Bacteroidales bacterium]|nr:DUF2723 domain-containing protein [Bacteroidales bacterium]
MKTYQRLNNLFGWLAFAMASLVYIFTLEPTASWWDCGEYISTAVKLQVGHPPGAPLFQMLGRFFSLFAGNDTSQWAYMVNLMSALSSSFTILFLFWSITMLLRKVVAPDNQFDTGRMMAILGGGFVGAMAYTFSDSFWFSAVEGEVYAMSSLFTAMVFWAILKWERAADEPHSLRWLILIAYLMGLSIGVHLLNLLAIPAIVYVYYYKKYTPTTKGFIMAGLGSLALLAIIMYGIIPDIVNLFSKVELLFVNSMGLPFNSGTIFFTLVIGATVVTGLLFTQYGDRYKLGFYLSGGLFLLLILTGTNSVGSFLMRAAVIGGLAALVYFTYHKRFILNTIILSFTFLLMGYSSFMMLVIRANANTPINENAPTDAIGLLSYLNREQYGDWPLFYGPYYNAPVKKYGDGNPVYIRDDKTGKYVVADDRKGTIPEYDPAMCTLFPRMHSNQKPSHIKAYQSWGEVQGVPVRVTKSDGKTETLQKPTFGENLKFFFNYQVGHMYLRYFMWNFVGRQNDVEGHGGITDGNWVSGIKMFDEPRLGSWEKYPAHRASNPANNTFYFLPLLLGLAGFFYHLKRNNRDTWVVSILFLLTGLAIVVYLNQTPFQPRERDYAYAGSFYAFAIWIGMGVAGIATWLQKLLKSLTPSAALAIMVSLSVPAIMASEGWDDHNRSGKFAARDFATNYLVGCQPEAILFTNGDNDTFPLWYVQEVENIRTDVRVVNYMLAGGEWYIHQLGKKVYDSDPLPLTLTPAQYDKGQNDIIPVVDLNPKQIPVPLKDVIKFISNDRNRRDFGSSHPLSYIPTKVIRIPVDTNAVKASGLVPVEMQHRILPYIDFTIKKNYLYKNDLMFLDLLATNDWKRPIYFASPSAMSAVFNVDQYSFLEGIVYKFLPVKATDDFIRGLGGVSTDSCYVALMNKITSWGRIEQPDVTIDRESFRNAQIPRQSYMRLAQSLINQGKKKEAIEVINTSFKFFPGDRLGLDKYTLPFAELYFSAGDTSAAVKLSRDIARVMMDDVIWYRSLASGPFANQFNSDLEENLMMMQSLIMLARRYNQTALAEELEKELTLVAGLN